MNKKALTPIPYYPRLATILGDVKQAVLLCHVMSWEENCVSGSQGVSRTAAEILEEAGLSWEEQRRARRALVKQGVLIEVHRRLEHKIFYRVDHAALDALVSLEASR
jgi:hypothetical protein